jgi:hypothetical protein
MSIATELELSLKELEDGEDAKKVATKILQILGAENDPSKPYKPGRPKKYTPAVPPEDVEDFLAQNKEILAASASKQNKIYLAAGGTAIAATAVLATGGASIGGLISSVKGLIDALTGND